MKIACVITVCAALISTFLNAESMRYKRRPRSRGQLSNPDTANDTEPSEITFTTLRPEVPTHNRNAQSNVRSASNQKFIRIRQGHPSAIIIRGPNGFTGTRRRRQLQRPVVKTGHLSRSYELADNHIETQKIEIAEETGAYEKGAIHLEPIYRVTKNTNIFDSIVDVVRRIVDPPRSAGPLVGPFHFPGIGEKVYIRLLEPVRPDHLVVRLISHLPAAEIETTLDQNILAHVSPGHPEIPSIDHATIVLPKDALSGAYKHGDVHFVSPDDPLSGNTVVQSSESASMLSQPTGQINGISNDEQGLKTYQLNLKSEELNGNHRVARHHKRYPVAGSTTNQHDYVQSRLNRTDHGDQHFAKNNFLDSFDRLYHYRAPANDSSKENFESFHYQSSQYPRNFSSSAEAFYSRPMNSYDTFSPSEISTSDSRLINSSAEFGEDAPRYSIDFASRNMRYLNLDGSVDPVIKDRSGEEFGSLQGDTISTKSYGSLDRERTPLGGVTARRKGTVETATSERDRKIFQERSDYNNRDEELLEVGGMSSDEVANYPRNATSNRSVVGSDKEGSRCCSRREDGTRNGKMNSGERKRNETTTVNNSGTGVKSNLSGESAMNPLQRLRSIRRNLNATAPRKV